MTKITTRGFKLTRGIEEKVKREIKNIDIQGRDLIDSNVVLSNHPDGKEAEISIKMNKKNFRVKSVDSDLYAAVELSFSKLQNKIRKHLQKKNRFNHRDSIRHGIDSTKDVLELQDEILSIEKESPIIKRQKISVKPMSEEEASLQMKAFKKSSLLFYNTDTNSPCMIYHCGDSTYGIVDSAISLPDNINYIS